MFFASTQNQAVNAIVFSNKHFLKQSLDNKINAIRALRKENVPIVMTREEVAQVISLMEGTQLIVVKLLYGSGLHVIEAVCLHVHNVDFTMKQITSCSGKGR